MAYDIYPGQLVKVVMAGTTRFMGVVNNVSSKKEGANTIWHNVDCTNMKNIPSRRTVGINYPINTTASVIVADMVNTYLMQEGITSGTINSGSVFADEWRSDIISVSDVLDECASRSGYQWFIDKNMALQFYQDPTTISYSSVTIGRNAEGFMDFRDVSVERTIDNYVNKSYILGGTDYHGDLIYTIASDLSKQNTMQQITAGSGVFGNIHNDSAIAEHEYNSTEAGTNETTIYLTAHPFITGDRIWNLATDLYTYITNATVSANYAYCEPVTGQTASQEIEIYADAGKIGRDILKKQSMIPCIISFKTFLSTFEPATALTVSLSEFNISGTFNIDEVNISDQGSNYFVTTVKAVQRQTANFSTAKNVGYNEFFKGF